MSASVQGGMARGALWMVLFKLLERSLGFISTLILVRVLSPGDFGVVAMAMSFIAMAELLAAFGFDIALIQDQNATEDLYHTAWTCNLAFGLSIALIMLISAPFIADFYNQPNLRWVVCALALGPAISGAENVGIVAFRKELRFRNEFLFQLGRKLVGFAVVVPLAFTLHSYWALVAGTLASRLGGTILSYVAHPFRPHISLVGARKLLHFSRWLLINNIAGFFKERSTDFAIGRIHGAAALGTYNVSYELASLPTTELSAPINRALLPGFARIAGDREAVAIAYSNAVGMLAILAVPAAAGIASIAPLLVPVLLGNQWLASVQLVQILALNGAMVLFHSSMSSLLIASGHPSRVMWTNSTFVVVLLVSLAILSTGGVVGAAYAILCTSTLLTPVYLYQVRHCLGIPASVFVHAALFPMLASAGMILVVVALLPANPQALPIAEAVPRLVGVVAAGGLTYATLVTLLWLMRGRPSGTERIILQSIQQVIARLRPSQASTPL
jgi:lipopolysaccharide exporter